MEKTGWVDGRINDERVGCLGVEWRIVDLE